MRKDKTKNLGGKLELPSFKPNSGIPESPWIEWGFRFLVLGFLALIFIPLFGAFGLWDPWETHYGEVGRQFVERQDWVSPWWGSHWQGDGGGTEGKYFYSKPVLLLWLMGIGIDSLGFNAWGVRAGVTVIVIFASFMIYVMGRQVFGRRAGVLMAIVTVTSPFWAMVGRQAQTDMPYVGLMTVGMCFFMMGVFGRQRDERAKLLDWVLLCGSFLLFFIPQMQLIWVKFGLAELVADPETGEMIANPARVITNFRGWGALQVILYCGLALAAMGSFLAYAKKRTKGDIYIIAFYIFVALATLAKGILGLGLPGLVILVYLLVTREWSMLRRVQLVRGAIVFFVIGFPWYLAMYFRHSRDWVQRFIVHDHLKRLSAGVHQIDNGSFEHFVKWLGYGLFPWGSFVPAALAQLASPKDSGKRTDEQRARLMLALWFIASFALFTLAQTKFHHYIFPCVPALSMLVALYFEDLIRGKVKSFTPAYITAFALFLLVGFDLVSDPENLKNLFTYQYERPWDASISAGINQAIQYIFVAGLVVFAFMGFRSKRLRMAALGGLIMVSSAMTVWSLDVYMPQLSVDWSQGYLWETYYGVCDRIEGPEAAPDFKRYCQQPVVAYRLNWRGEAYYTQNEVIPLENEGDYRFFLEQNDGQSFFAIMQRGRRNSFQSRLSTELRAGMEEIHTENQKFILIRVLNAEDLAAREEWLNTPILDPSLAGDGSANPDSDEMSGRLD